MPKAYSRARPAAVAVLPLGWAMAGSGMRPSSARSAESCQWAMPMPAAALHQAPTAALIALTEMPRRLFRSFVNYFRSWNPRAKCFPMVYLDSSDDNALVVYTPSSLRPGPATPATASAVTSGRLISKRAFETGAPWGRLQARRPIRRPTHLIRWRRAYCRAQRGQP